MALFGADLPSVKRQVEAEALESSKRVKAQVATGGGRDKNGRGRGGGGRGSGGGSGGNNRLRTQGSPESRTVLQGCDEALLKALPQLALRHEDLLQRLSQDTTHVWMFENVQGPQQVLSMMYNVTQTWKKLRDETPEKLTRNLRTTVILALFQELSLRLTRVREVPEAKAVAEKRGWLLNDQWLYLRWSHDQGALVKDTEVEPVPLATLETQVQRALVLLKSPGVLHKFQSTRPLAEELTGNTLCFLSELSLRGPEAHELWSLINSWYGLAALNMIGLRIRPARALRSKLADQLQQGLGRCFP